MFRSLNLLAAATLLTSLCFTGCGDTPGGAPAELARNDQSMSGPGDAAASGELAQPDESRSPRSSLHSLSEATKEAGDAEPAGPAAPADALAANSQRESVRPTASPVPLGAVPHRDLSSVQPPTEGGQGPGMGGDRFDHIQENEFLGVTDQPLSTFSIDVDTASYAKTRRYLIQNGRLPPPDAVRIEEFINYFEYAYASPEDNHPFAVHVEMADCPWRDGHRIARIGIQGRRIERERPPTNLVFLIDVSGSMDYADKLPLVKQSLHMLASRLGENDRVAIVVYAGAAGLVLPSTTGDQRSTILTGLERLHAGGSTNGGQGIHLAYQVALDNYIAGGVNRVLLCTDGDFNVGTTSTGALVRLAEQQAQSGVFLSVLAFGQGNHNDAMLEQISNKANGNYAFIDTEAEAHKVLVEQLSSTLVTIAKDVKLQVEFNPRRVASYRLVGYENRKLADRDFNDDKKDAGEIGAGHQVTALYELIPAGEDNQEASGTVDPLKYQESKPAETAAASQEWMTVKVRYKRPDEDRSTLLSYPVAGEPKRFGQANADFQFVSAVASFGMLLRRSEHRGAVTYASVHEIASSALGEDRHGYRREFLELVGRAAELDHRFGTELPEARSEWDVRPGQSSLIRPTSPVTPTATVTPTSTPPQASPTPQSVLLPAWAAWSTAIVPARWLSRGSIFWMGATFGLLTACAILLACWKLPRMRLSSQPPEPVPSLFRRHAVPPRKGEF